MHTLESLRQDFELRTNRSLSMPMAGAAACAIAVVVSYGVSIYLMSTRRIASAPVRTGT